MDRDKSTISLTAPPDSDWGKVEQFVIDRGYTPVFVSWESYIACMILSYEGDLENDGITEAEMPLDDWLFENFGRGTGQGGNYRMKDFDYE